MPKIINLFFFLKKKKVDFISLLKVFHSISFVLSHCFEASRQVSDGSGGKHGAQQIADLIVRNEREKERNGLV